MGYVSAIDSNGRTIWIADAHRDDGKRFVVHADEKLTALLKLESVISGSWITSCNGVVGCGRCITPRLIQLSRNKSLSKAFVIAAIVLMRGQIMAQVSTLTEPTSLSPVPAATVSEAKPTPKDTATDNSTLDSLLKQEGFGVVKLEKKNLGNQKAHKNYPKHLIIDVEVNRVSASLMVDTGTPEPSLRGTSSRNSALSSKRLLIQSPVHSDQLPTKEGGGARRSWQRRSMESQNLTRLPWATA